MKLINKKTLTITLGLLISSITLFIVFKRIDIELFLDALSSIKIFPFLLMIVVYLIGFAFRGLRSEIMLDPFKNISWLRAVTFVIIGYAANVIFPARLGEVFRAYLTGKKEGISKATVFGSIAIEHIFDGLTLLAIFSITAVFADFNPEYETIIRQVGITGGIIFSLAFGGILFIRLKKELTKNIISKIVSPIQDESIKFRILTITGNLISSTSFLKVNKTLPIFIFCTLSIWLLEGIVFILALYALDLPISWIFAFFVLAFTSLGLATPSAPAYVGVFQGLVLMAFSFFGMNMEKALAFSVINNIVMVVPIAIIGLVLLNFFKESIWDFNKKEESISAQV